MMQRLSIPFCTKTIFENREPRSGNKCRDWMLETGDWRKTGDRDPRIESRDPGLETKSEIGC